MRLISCGSKFLAVAAVGLFLAACEKAPENAANTGGSGSSTMSTGPSTSGIASGSVQDFQVRSEEHTSELQSLMRSSYAVFCLNKKTNSNITNTIVHFIIQFIYMHTSSM